MKLHSDSPSRRTAGILLTALGLLCVLSVLLGIRVGSVRFSLSEVLRVLFVDDASSARLLIWHFRLPRVLVGGLVGVCLALSGCILQGVLGNHLASPSTIGVTAGAGFVGHLVLVAFPGFASLLPVGTVLGALGTTLLIYLLAFRNGVTPVRMILSGLAVSALFGAGSDLIKTLFADSLGNASGFLVGGLNGCGWDTLDRILPYALFGMVACLLVPRRLNLLLLGDEAAAALGLRTERFRFLLLVLSSLLAGSAIAAAGLIGFVGLIVPHFARLLVGSDYKVLFPASALLGFSLVTVCDTVGRILLPAGELPVSVLLAVLGAPCFLWLLRTRSTMKGGR
jgi:iron complex transport system permease protein